MNTQLGQPTVDHTKKMAIIALFTLSFLITVSGVAFSVYSIVNHVQFSVMGSQIHGAVWGTVIAFLGFRSVAAVMKLKTEVYKNTSVFSWNNFRSEKALLSHGTGKFETSIKKGR